LQLLIERLLQLASAGAQALERHPVLIDEFVNGCIADLAILAEARGQTIVVDAESAVIETDPVLLRQALQNIVDNAIKYGPAQGTIRVETETHSDHCTISVTDSGPGIPEEDRARLTDRFFRVDRARSRNPAGFGLGLSITSAYLRVLGGRLECVSAQPHGSTFRLILPRRAG